MYNCFNQKFLDGDYVALNGLVRFYNFAKIIKHDIIILYYAWKHPGTPPSIKALLAALTAYVFSPIDIIPDYLPFIGITDDVAIITVAVLFLTKMLPQTVREDCERESAKWRTRLPWLLGAFVLFIVIWLVIAIIGTGYFISLIK